MFCLFGFSLPIAVYLLKDDNTTTLNKIRQFVEIRFINMCIFLIIKVFFEVVSSEISQFQRTILLAIAMYLTTPVSVSVTK